MCSVVMPIYSEHANNIYKKIKKYEYRHVAPSKKVDYLLLYETKPVCAITGVVEVKAILQDSPEHIWKHTKDYSGISRQLFDVYYKNRTEAVAYMLGDVVSFNKPKKLSDVNIKNIPQSFQYIDDSILHKIINVK